MKNTHFFSMSLLGILLLELVACTNNGSESRVSTSGVIVGAGAGAAVGTIFTHLSVPVASIAGGIGGGLLNSEKRKIDRVRAQGVRIITVGDSVRIILPTDDFFLLNSTELRFDPDPALDSLATLIKSYGNVDITVAGYTDSISSVHHSQRFSLMQAESVIAYLWHRGVDHRHMQPIGYGKAEKYTISNNHFSTGSALNRRVEITFRKGPYSTPSN